MPGPLEGVRVLDLTNIIAGPLGSLQLSMLGAEVIKVEKPNGGDLARKMGADPEFRNLLMGVSFCMHNAGKKSITLNLKNKTGKEIFKRLVKDADVVLENYRPGVMKKLGLDYSVLKEVNPGIIFCAVSGFGQEGPLAGRPSYDQVIQGFSGLMSLTGTKKTAPIRSGYVVCDSMAAMTAAFAICAALYRKQKTGIGDRIDVSMLDSTLSTMASSIISNYLNAGKVPEPMGNENLTASPSGTYKTKDGLINIVNNEQNQFEGLCKVIGMPELITHPRYAERNHRIENRDELHAVIEEKLLARTSGEWEVLFEKASVPAGPILTVPQVMAHPQVARRKLVRRFENVAGTGRAIDVLRLGFDLESGQPDTDMPPPRLGQDTTAILNAIGYSDGDIEQLQKQGAI